MQSSVKVSSDLIEQLEDLSQKDGDRVYTLEKFVPHGHLPCDTLSFCLIQEMIFRKQIIILPVLISAHVEEPDPCCAVGTGQPHYQPLVWAPHSAAAASASTLGLAPRIELSLSVLCSLSSRHPVGKLGPQLVSINRKQICVYLLVINYAFQ